MADTKTLRRNADGLLVIAALLAFCGCTEVPKYCPACGGDGNNESTTYKVKVTDGVIDKDEYAAGDTVTISAKEPPKGQHFKKWQAESGGVSFAHADSAITTFVMPANEVEVKAVFDTTKYSVIVTGGDGKFGDGYYAEGRWLG